MEKTVVLGMSGGVDSSVSAYLLKEQGYNVIGLFMKNWDPALNGDLADPFINKEICQAEEDYQDALKVANELGIELHRVDFVKEYWDQVFEYFINEYREGRTPNPDIFCNKYIKFNAFLDYAEKNFNCDYIAMGHYAKIEDRGGKVQLVRGDDSNKDQTYFLSQLSEEQISKTLFPVGDLEKSEVRKIADEQNLTTAKKKDSTGICFIGERNFAKFLSSYLVDKSGDVLDYTTGEKVGEHKGLFYYTIGQRRGLGIGGSKTFSADPWFVVGKNLEENTLYVSQDENLLKSNRVVVDTLNILTDDFEEIKSGKFRYRSDDVLITEINKIDDERVEVQYETTSAVTPGQALVFYNEDICLGGGIVKQVYRNSERLEV